MAAPRPHPPAKSPASTQLFQHGWPWPIGLATAFITIVSAQLLI